MAQQKACVYAALLLSESGKTDAATLQAVCKAGKVDVSKGMATAFAALLKDCNIEDVCSKMTFGGGCAAAAGGAAPAAGGAAAAAPAAAEEEEEEDEGMFGLFD